MIRAHHVRRTSLGALAVLMVAVICLQPVFIPAGVRAARQAPAVDQAATDPRFGATEASSQPVLADSLGVRWTRIPFIWRYVQPNGPSS